MAKLEIRYGDREETFEIGDDEVPIGKLPRKNKIVISDNRVSREHARIFRAGGRFMVEDRGSLNGTYLDGKPLQPRQPQPLLPGSVIDLADACTITFTEVREGSGEVGMVRFDDAPLGQSVVIRSPGQVAEEEKRPKDLSAMATASPHALIEDLYRAQKQIEKQAQRLKLLYQLDKTLGSVFSLDEIYRRAVDVLFEVTPVDRCCILLQEEGKGLAPALLRTRDNQPMISGRKLLISGTITQRVMEEKVSLASFSAMSDERLRESESIISHGINSVICAPLLARSGVLGVIYADRQDPRDTFSVDDLELLNAIAGAASMSIENTLSHERLSREALARAAYGRFMPQHVVDQILASPESLARGGSNQTATILFADIRGFTPIAEHRRPDEVVGLLNTYFQAMTEVIFAHGGTLDKYIGDGIMALFGAPYATDHDATDAVDAAADMQRRLTEMAAELRGASLPEIGIGIGINTGEVTVGYIGSEKRLDYTAIGDAVNLAARLEQSAAKGQIRISDSTRRAIGGKYRTVPLGDLAVKGRHETSAIFEVAWR